MDSGNTSGSLQSSSGGDDEFDSRSNHQIPSNNNPSSAATTTHFSNQNQNLLSLHNLPSTSTVLFDPSTSYLQSFSSHPQSNSLLNMDFLRSSSSSRPRSASDLGNFTGALFGNQQQQPPNFMPNPCPPPPVLMQPRSSMIHDHPLHGKLSTSASASASASEGLNQNQNQSSSALGVRNSKKRTRASRRAPTTVLTTDTSNFRAMVQEFTGIPAPPFSGSSYSRRLDLFGSSSLRSGHLDPMYPLRPSAHKIHPSPNPFLNPSSTILDMHNNPLLSFQSLLQPHPHPHQQMPSLQLQDQIQQQQHHQQQQLNVSSGSGQGWRSGVGSTQDHHLRASNSNDHNQPAGYNPSQQERSNIGASATIFNYTPAPPSDFDHHHQTANPTAPRGDGTVDSWICPSD